MDQFGVTAVWLAGVLLSVSTAWSQVPAQSGELDALAKLNQQFRVSYAGARADVLQASYPVLLYDGSKLVLIKGPEKRLEGEPVPALYHRLKALAHLPFTAYLELRQIDGALAEVKLQRLVALRKLLAAVEAELPTYEFGSYDPDRQKRILARTTALVDGVIARRASARKSLEEFTRELGPDMYENTLAAAAIELGHHHREINGWLRDLDEAEKGRLRVVVCGSQMPRSGHRIVQLAAAILGLKGEGPRIVYAEAIYEEQRALNLLGTHRLDAESAAAFFGDETKLDRDILADGAARYVGDHLSPAKP